MSTHNKFYKSLLSPALVTAFLLLIPLLAMQFTNEMKWNLFDFIFAGFLIFGTGFTYKLATSKNGNLIYRVAMGLALGTAFILIWGNLAVGIIGAEDNPINLLYFGVIAIGVIGASIARFSEHGMSITLYVVALAHALVVVIALISGIQESPAGSVSEILTLNSFFVVLWIGSALLFRYASRIVKPKN